MTKNTSTENPMAKALADADYFTAGAIAAEEIERLETQLTQLRQDKTELIDTLQQIADDTQESFPVEHGSFKEDFAHCHKAAEDAIAKARKEP